MKKLSSRNVIFITVLFLCIITAGIGYKAFSNFGSSEENKSTSSTHKMSTPFNGIYFWRTSFKVTEEERLFLTTHNINRLYLRLFDVDIAQQNLWKNEQPTPVATLLFPDSTNTAITAGLVEDIVPTCFITLSALKMMKGSEQEYAQKIIQRMLNICSYHHLINKVSEIQIDCDWTESTQELYFSLLKEMRELLQEKGLQLSVTIRLHQLRVATPPVDKGTLMLYNTGSIKNYKTSNSILSFNDAAQYLSNSAVVKYKLPLDYALPTFRWGVWFRDNKYMGILHKSDFTRSDYYQPIDNTHFLVEQDHILEQREIHKGDIIRLEQSDYQTIMQVKTLLPFGKRAKSDFQPSIILYHLDNNNLKQYEHQEISNLYSTSAEL